MGSKGPSAIVFLVSKNTTICQQGYVSTRPWRLVGLCPHLALLSPCFTLMSS